MINQSNIFKKIGYILNELQDQYQFLSENPEQLSELELELFLANANFLSDHVEIVKKLNNNTVIKELPQHIEVIKQDIAQPTQLEQPIEDVQPIVEVQTVQEIPESDNLLIEEIEREELQQEDLPPTFEFVFNENTASDRFDFEDKSVVEMYDRTLSEDEERIIAEKQRLANNAPMSAPQTEQVFEPETQEAPRVLIVDKIEEKEIPAPIREMVIDKLERREVRPDANSVSPGTFGSVQRPTLNELLAGKNSSNTLSEETARPVIANLKRAITLNEKLLYIKDLFNGYNLAYSEAIDLIDKMPDFKTADLFLQNNYGVKNNWEAKQSTVDQFYELLKQRFPEG